MELGELLTEEAELQHQMLQRSRVTTRASARLLDGVPARRPVAGSAQPRPRGFCVLRAAFGSPRNSFRPDSESSS